MQVEQPHHAPHSVTEFLRQYAMIVLSILTALGLEQVAVSMHDASAARASRARIEAELAHNLADLKTAEQSNAENAKALAGELRKLVDELRGGKAPGDAMAAELKTWPSHLGISSPTWERDAWDGAIADHSAANLAAADLSRYAEIYAAAQDNAVELQVLLGGEWLTRMSDVTVDIRSGKPDAHAIATTLARFLLASQQIDSAQLALARLVEGGHPAGVTQSR